MIKVLIWIGSFVGGFVFFVALGAVFGLEGRIFNGVAIAGMIGLAELLCQLVDKRDERKRLSANEDQNTEADLFQEIKEDEIEIIRPKVIKRETISSEVSSLGNTVEQHISENDISDKTAVETVNVIITEKANSTESNEEFVFCRKCGTQLLSDSEFCHKCGCEKVR